MDAILLLREAGSLDWDLIVGLARDGGFYRPLRYFFALLKGIGVPMEGVPAFLSQPPGGLGRTAFERVLEDFRCLFPYELPLVTALWRELTLCAEPSVAFHNLGLRLCGLYRPLSGLPEGVTVPGESLPFANSSNVRT